MKNKKFYLAVTIENNKKYYSYILKVPSSDNLLNKLKIKNIIHANICDTRKEARYLVSEWNGIYRENGTYLFDNSPLF